MTKTGLRRAKNNKRQALPLLSFFTGGGFLDMGFERAGFQIVWTNEVNDAFADLYEYGMTEWRKHTRKKHAKTKISSRENIQRLYAGEITSQAFPWKKPALFGIIGGPPCPDFSAGGKNKGHKGANGRLTKIYFNRIRALKPAFFIFENVPGLYKTRIHREFLKREEKKLERSGYCLDLNVLNALEMGVPQDRERLIMVGVRKSFAKKCAGKTITPSERNWFPWPLIPEYRGARKKYEWPTMVKFGDKPRKPRGIPSELTVDFVLNGRSYPEKRPNGKDAFRAISRRFSRIKEGDTKRKSFKRLHRYRFSPTACYGHNEVHLHPWKMRRLSVREAMRIQGIPDEYALPEKAPLSWKFTVVSNGVPVPLAYQVARCLKKFLKPLSKIPQK